jgi:hypothetical protein
VDIPVDKMMVRPVARSRRSSSSSVSDAEATLCAGTSNCSRKSTDSTSQGEANQAMPRCRACSSMAAYSSELDPVPVVDVGHPPPGRVPLDLPLVARGADLGRALLELHGVAAGGRGLVDQREGVAQLAVVVDADLAGDVDRATRADDRVTDGPGGGREGGVRAHVLDGRKITLPDGW